MFAAARRLPESQTRIISSTLIGLSLPIGSVAAAAALYGRYRALPAFLTGPTICHLEDNGCQILFRTPLAAVFGVPNSLLGLAYYSSVGVGLAAGWPVLLLVAAASLALGFSVYLGGRLIRDRLECRICWTGHAANLSLWIGLVVNAIGVRR